VRALKIGHRNTVRFGGVRTTVLCIEANHSEPIAYNVPVCDGIHMHHAFVSRSNVCKKPRAARTGSRLGLLCRPVKVYRTI
jgi:hypothetical protein